MSSTPRPLRAVEDAPSGGPLLTVEQLVGLLGDHGVTVSANKAYRLLDRGVIPSTNLGSTTDRKVYLIHRAEVLDWLAHGDLNRRREQPPVLTPDVIADAVAAGIKRAFRGVA